MSKLTYLPILILIFPMMVGIQICLDAVNNKSNPESILGIFLFLSGVISTLILICTTYYYIESKSTINYKSNV
jgi:hypothetical protein